MTTTLKINAEDVERWEGCPISKTHDIQGGPVEIEGRESWQQVECLDCGLSWAEVYVASHRIFERGRNELLGMG